MIEFVIMLGVPLLILLWIVVKMTVFTLKVFLPGQPIPPMIDELREKTAYNEIYDPFNYRYHPVDFLFLGFLLFLTYFAFFTFPWLGIISVIVYALYKVRQHNLKVNEAIQNLKD